MKTFLLEIVSPEKVTFKNPVSFLAAPGAEGELGILPGHTHLLAQLLPGLIRFKQEEKETTLAISGGFLEVHPNRVAVFAETAEMAEEIDEERARQALERAKATLAAKSKADLAVAQASLQKALVRLRAAKRRRL